MPEIGTSGSMSGDGKRGVAEWPKLPRPSSTLPSRPISYKDLPSAFGGRSGSGRAPESAASVENDPTASRDWGGVSIPAPTFFISC